jgi:hypothetical protein
MVCGGDLGVILTFKNQKVLKMFGDGKYRIKLALCKLSQRSTS